jgi:hypothetical protein
VLLWDSITFPHQEFHNYVIKKQWSLKRLKLGPKGQKPSQHEHTPLFTLWLNFDKNNGTLNGKRRMGPLKEGHNLNKGGLKVK